MGSSRRMDQKKLFYLVLPTLVLFLFFFTFWYLIYFEKSSELVFGSFALMGALFLYSLGRSWKGAQEFGLRFDNLASSIRAVLLPMAALIGVSVLISSRSPHTFKLSILGELPSFFVWGLIQQGVIQGYFFRHFESVFKPRRRLTIFCTALVFGLLHSPNLHLMAITFLGGVYLSWLFSKYRNLFAVGLMHGMISLVLVSVLKPAGFIPNYRVGPEPMSPIRTLIHQHKAPGDQVGGMGAGDIPSSLEHDFEAEYHALQSEDDLIRFLKRRENVFVVLSREDYERFITRHPDRAGYLWKSSLVWKRKFPEMKRKVTEAILKLDGHRLHTLFRASLVLISNRPLPSRTTASLPSRTTASLPSARG